MNIFLWILQAVLAAAFLGAGLMKLTQPKSKLQENMGWVEDFSDNAVKGIGAAEVLGAIGLILPRALNIAPVLTPVAAVGCAIVMAGATVVHTRMKDYKGLGMPVVLLILAIIVVAGRF